MEMLEVQISDRDTIPTVRCRRSFSPSLSFRPKTDLLHFLSFTGYSSPLPVPTGATNGSSSSDASRAMLENLRAQALASNTAHRASSSSAAPSSHLPSLNDPSQGGLRGGASSSSSSARDPRTDHPSFHPSSSYRRGDDDRDDGSGIASTSTSYPFASSSSNSSSSNSNSNYRVAPPRDPSTGKHASHHHRSPPQLSPPSSSSDTLSTPPPILPLPSTSLLQYQLPPLPPAPLPNGQLGSFNNQQQPDFFGAGRAAGGGGWNRGLAKASLAAAGGSQSQQGGGVVVPGVWAAPEGYYY